MTQKCPVCNGRGMVEKAFYPDDATTEHPRCQRCNGRGWVYEVPVIETTGYVVNTHGLRPGDKR